jgi:hypothetical protein
VAVLPSAVSLALGALLARPVLRTLRRRGWTQANYRGAALPCPTGLVLVGPPLPALASGYGLRRLTGAPVLAAGAPQAAIFATGVAALGLLDDRGGHGPQAPRGVRGHLRALGRGPSTGIVKAAGTAALAVCLVIARSSPVAAHRSRATGRASGLVAAATLTLAPHLFNLLDLRPGRSLKALALVGGGLTLGTLDLVTAATLGPLLAPGLVLLPIDLRERGMLGDTGASAAGAIAGLWVVLTLPVRGQAIALATTALLTAYGELRSIAALVEGSPLLRQLDSLGRCR